MYRGVTEVYGVSYGLMVEHSVVVERAGWGGESPAHDGS